MQTMAPAVQEQAHFRGEAPGARVEPMSVMRQKIAEHMVFSKHTSAHVTTVHKVDMTKIAKIRAKLKNEFQARHGFGLRASNKGPHAAWPERFVEWLEVRGLVTGSAK